MIRVLLAHQGCLVRGALASVLDSACDIEVVAESAHGDELLELVRRSDPDVTVLDFGLPGTVPVISLCAQLTAHVNVLIMAERRTPAGHAMDVATMAPRVGLVATESPLGVLIDGVRKLNRGETVLDGDLARSALSARLNPLTEREREVLRLADAGLTARDIAAKLFLSHGTVRNHLSRVLTKTGGRNRIEAIRIAYTAGWI